IGCCGANLELKNSTISASSIVQTNSDGFLKISNTRLWATPLVLPECDFTISKSLFEFRGGAGAQMRAGTITDSSFSGAGSGAALEISTSASYRTIAISGSTFADNPVALKISGGTTFTVQSGNNFIRNTTNLENRTTKAIAATGNYWGVATATE